MIRANPVNKPRPDELWEANQSDLEYQVTLSIPVDAMTGLSQGVVQINRFYEYPTPQIPFSLPPQFPSPTSCFRVDTGFIVSADEGEKGGGIFAFDESGQQCTTILQCPCLGLLHLQGTIFAICGHQNQDNGQIMRLEKNSHSSWHTLPAADHFDHAVAFTQETSQSALILTRRYLMRCELGFGGNLAMQRLMEHDFRDLYPNSMVISQAENGCVYIGMRKYVVRLPRDMSSGQFFREEWFLPQES